MKKIYIVTDLGPGDGGKGGVVRKIATMKRARGIVKVGGAQGSHGVRTSGGERFAFSQWGCGTLDGIPTHLSSHIVVSPIGLLNEAEALRYSCGIHDPFALLTADEEALCATPYHGIASRLKELARGENPRGTIGSGVGEAYRDSQRFPELSLRVRDLSRSDLRDRLAAIREQVAQNIASIPQGNFLSADREDMESDMARLDDDGFLDFIVDQFREVAARTTIVDHGFLGREILSQDGVVVVESSHGVLTDNHYGFHPHTSAIRTVPRIARALIDEAEYTGDVVQLGVSRAYQIRHGAGPMPTANPALAEKLLPGSNKEASRFQGVVRVGPLDLVLLRYAIAACGGPSAFDGLAITWFDQVQANGVWHLCHRYSGADDREYFTAEGEIIVREGDGATQFVRQEALGQRLALVTPDITTRAISQSTTRDHLYGLCADVLREPTGIPVRMVSFGPTERDTICR